MGRLQQRLKRRKRQSILRRSRSALGIRIPSPTRETPVEPIKLRKYAKPPTTPLEPTVNPEPLESPDQNVEPQDQDQDQATPNLEDNLEEVYTKVKSAPNYSAKIAEFLRKNNVHSTHRRVVKKTFPRRHIIVHFPFQIFMADLIEYLQPDYKHANRNYGYILVTIDVFSKMVYVRPVKKKDKFSVSQALQSILINLDHYPNTLITDEGLEFYNSNVKELLDKYGIHHYSIKTKMKASVVERFNRTLRQKLEKYFVKNNTKCWIDVLQQFVDNYNNTPHRSIGMAPSKVTDENADQVFKELFPDIELESKPRLSVGDTVRILKEKTIFEKGYKQTWSDELYKVRDVKQAAGRIWYELDDLEGVKVSGIKYYWELNLVDDSQH